MQQISMEAIHRQATSKDGNIQKAGRMDAPAFCIKKEALLHAYPLRQTRELTTVGHARWFDMHAICALS